MKIGILGSGEVGRALGSGFAVRGHDVKIGSRSPRSAELVAWSQKAGSKASTGTFAEAAKHGEGLLLPVQGTAAERSKTSDRKSTPLNFRHRQIPEAGLFF